MFPPHIQKPWLVVAILSGTVCATTLSAEESPARAQASARPAIIKQDSIGPNACGPCAVLNVIAYGSPRLRALGKKLAGKTPEERVQTLIDKYCVQPSTAYDGKRKRYTVEHGIAATDMPELMNEFLAEHGDQRVAGTFVDREKDESGGKHLRRIHGLLKKSLAAGVPPILEIRSFAARPAGEEHKWYGMMGHFVVVVELDPEIPDGDKGFRLRYADSFTGNVETAYFHAEEARNFTATKKFTVDAEGKEQWEWVSDFPYLVVTAPSLRLLTQKEPWHQRTMIVLRHVIVAREALAEAK